MSRFAPLSVVVFALVAPVLAWSPAAVSAQSDPATCNGLVATIVGTDGDDVIQGTWQADVIVGLDGNDTINGASGADTICGGDGNDVISGQSQDDIIFGDAGDDTINGDSGADVIDGGSGNDTIRGQSQDDVVQGGEGDDDINGDSGNDDLDGGNGFDLVDGSWGTDICDDAETAPNCETITSNGETGTGPGTPVTCDGLIATIVGTDSDDVLQGTWQDDVIVGLGGNDTINGASGADVICGGEGDDVVNGQSQDDRIFGGLGNDTINGDSGADTIDGGPGNDTIRGQSQNDTIHGGNGDDDINGGPGSDELDGGNGIDIADGSWQNDTCDDFETTSNCETETANGETDDVEIVEEIIEIPENPIPLTFTANTDAFVGVDLQISTTGGLYPWDITVDEAATTAAMNDLVVSELIDININPNAPGFDSATLTLGYDETLVNEVAESALKIWTYDETAQLWVPAGVEQTVDVNANTVTATLEHFSIYTILEMDLAQPELWNRVWGSQPELCVPNLGLDLGPDLDAGFGVVDTTGTQLVADSEGGVFVVGRSFSPTGNSATIESITDLGLISESFGDDGTITIEFSAQHYLKRILARPSGGLVAVLSTFGSGPSDRVLAYDSSGVPDASFGIVGVVDLAELVLPGQPASVRVNDISVGSDDQILFRFGDGVVRLLSDGSVDAGYVSPDLGEDLFRVSFATSGRIYVIRDWDFESFVVERFTSDGVFDAAFGSVEYGVEYSTTTPGRTEYFPTVFELPDGGVAIEQAHLNGEPVRIDYFGSNGLADGRRSPVLPGDSGVVGIDTDGRVVLQRSDSREDPGDLIRLGTNAQLDSSFGADGTAEIVVDGVRLQILSAVMASTDRVIVVWNNDESGRSLGRITEGPSVAAEDGTDTDLDTITDCTETNGAFTPAAQSLAGPGYIPIVTGYTDSYITTNPNSADTDNDGLDDNTELVEADLRDNTLIAETYAYLIDAGITRYYKLISDPNDPLSIGSFETTIDRFDDGLLRVDGLDVPQTTLFQPNRYGNTPIIESRLTPRRTDEGFSVSTLTYTGAPVTYDEGENCVDECAEVETLAQVRKDDGRFGCSVFGDDLECEIKEIVSEARSDQGVFTDDDFVSSGFLRDQIALRCAISGSNVDRCVDGAALLFFYDIEPGEIDLIVDTFLQNDAEFLIPGEFYLIEEMNTTSTIGPGDIERFETMRRAVTNLYLNFDLIDADEDDVVLLTDLEQFNDPVADPTGDLREAALFAANDQRLLDEYGVGTGYRRFQFAVALVRSHGFSLYPGLAQQVLESFPSVIDNAAHPTIPLDTFAGGVSTTGNKPDASLALIELFEQAIASTGPTERVVHNDLVSRLPETYSGIRNNLITAMYIEYSVAIQQWLERDRTPAEREQQGSNWGKYAPWASQAIREPITNDLTWQFVVPGPLFPALRQTSADGNQWIFHDVGSRFAEFVELIEANPDPTAEQWQTFFNDGDRFVTGEQTLRDGFVALAAARYEPDIERSQELLFQSALLFATHEQAGVHPFLQPFDIGIAPDFAEGWFTELEMGEDRKIETAIDVYDRLNFDPEGVGPDLNTIWASNILDLDPTDGDQSQIYDTDGLDIEIGGTGIGVVNLSDITGVPYALPASWSTWRDENVTVSPPVFGEEPPPTYSAVRATQWSDWEERMWFLANLFRTLHTDALVAQAPDDKQLGSTATADFTASTLEKLRINEP